MYSGLLRTAGLTDYEAWVLNDGINKLLREKGYLDDQIIAHGGAIYGRNITMIDDDDNGLDVLEAMGYKCANPSPTNFFRALI
jgi:pre-mRNA-splicing factor ISY1